MKKIKEIIVKAADWLGRTFTGKLGYAIVAAIITEIAAIFKNLAFFAFIFGMIAAWLISLHLARQDKPAESTYATIYGTMGAVIAQLMILLYLICW